MTGLVGLFSRIALFVCGIVSILLGRTFAEMQALMPDFHVQWSLFSVPLIPVGGLTVLIALLPDSWVKKMCNSGSGKQTRSSIPIRLLGGFAVFSYVFTVGLNFVPPSWAHTAPMVYLVCPSCVLTITVDPSLAAIMLVLAPLNAAAYGSLGALLGYFFLAIRNRI